MIANSSVPKTIINETVVESGRSSILQKLKELKKHKTLYNLRIFVPHIHESEYNEIDSELRKLRDEYGVEKIEWFLIKKDPDTPKIKNRFKKHEIEFHVLTEYKQTTDDIDLLARYYLTRAFLGDPKTGKFDSEFLKKIIEVFSPSNKKKTVHAPRHFEHNQASIEGISPDMLRFKKRINSVAKADLNVLIRGATGSGKEGAAFFLHDLSERNKKNFEAINCALFDEKFLISELFGHKKGAFTGANKDRDGLIKHVDGGTLFLDELPDMPKTCQAMLLRFLQDGRIRPMGSDSYDDKKYDVRIICAGQSHLLKEKIREDLIYRIGEVKIDVPPLKDTIKEDMPLLIDHCLYKESRKPADRYQVKDFFMKNRSVFENYSWPGNVRQLFIFVKRRLKIGKEEEKEILKEINEDLEKQETDSEFFNDFKAIVSKHRNSLPSSKSVKLNYTKLVSDELMPERTQKYVAKEVLKFSEYVRKTDLKKLENS